MSAVWTMGCLVAYHNRSPQRLQVVDVVLLAQRCSDMQSKVDDLAVSSSAACLNIIKINSFDVNVDILSKFTVAGQRVLKYESLKYLDSQISLRRLGLLLRVYEMYGNPIRLVGATISEFLTQTWNLCCYMPAAVVCISGKHPEAANLRQPMPAVHKSCLVASQWISNDEIYRRCHWHQQKFASISRFRSTTNFEGAATKSASKRWTGILHGARGDAASTKK